MQLLVISRHSLTTTHSVSPISPKPPGYCAPPGICWGDNKNDRNRNISNNGYDMLLPFSSNHDVFAENIPQCWVKQFGTVWHSYWTSFCSYCFRFPSAKRPNRKFPPRSLPNILWPPKILGWQKRDDIVGHDALKL